MPSSPTKDERQRLIWEQLVAKGQLTYEDLCQILAQCECLRALVWNYIRKQPEAGAWLADLACHLTDDDRRRRAFDHLLDWADARPPGYQIELLKVMRCRPEWASSVWQALRNGLTTSDEERQVVNVVVHALADQAIRSDRDNTAPAEWRLAVADAMKRVGGEIVGDYHTPIEEILILEQVWPSLLDLNGWRRLCRRSDLTLSHLHALSRSGVGRCAQLMKPAQALTETRLEIGPAEFLWWALCRVQGHDLEEKLLDTLVTHFGLNAHRVLVWHEECGVQDRPRPMYLPTTVVDWLLNCPVELIEPNDLLELRQYVDPCVGDHLNAVNRRLIDHPRSDPQLLVYVTAGNERWTTRLVVNRLLAHPDATVANMNWVADVCPELKDAARERITVLSLTDHATLMARLLE